MYQELDLLSVICKDNDTRGGEETLQRCSPFACLQTKPCHTKGKAFDGRKEGTVSVKKHSRGVAFVEFKEHKHAIVCLRVLNNNPEGGYEELPNQEAFATWTQAKQAEQKENKKKDAKALLFIQQG
uniref:RRM domain-containing protein n=1 Tax=Ananas comosus var. bracteatus TaxID=296719 RepID=A0A6V7QBW1_ANACO|nr:unnamed protein product [Ananas comosus var. bracteatus]